MGEPRGQEVHALRSALDRARLTLRGPTLTATAPGVGRADRRIGSSCRGYRPETGWQHTSRRLGEVDTQLGALAGYTVGVTADRRSDEQIELFERRGARVLHGPTIRTLPLDDDERLHEANRSVIERPPDLVILTTAIGARSWHGAAESRNLGDALLDALGRAVVIARGPKAKGAAVTLGLDVAWTAPNARIFEIVDHVKATAPAGCRIALQLDGGTNAYIADELEAAGFQVTRVAIYRWTLPEDLGPATRLVTAVCDRSVDAITFTASPALRNFFTIAERAGRLAEVTGVLASGAVDAVCVGPACTEAAAAAGVPVTVAPVHFRLGAMVQAYATSVAHRSSELTLAGIPVMVQGRVVCIDGDDEVQLSDRERDVLAVLARRPGAVVSKATLVREVWSSSDGDEHVAEVTVGRLRQRLGSAGAGIETVVRRGYRLCDEPLDG